MASFYYAKTIHIEELPIIFYPEIGLSKKFDRKDKGCLEKYIEELYSTNRGLLKNNGQYHILILWINEADIMADVWIYDKIESWGSGPLVDVKIFKNLNIETNMGVTAGDGLITLGREEEHRRSKSSLEAYLNNDRPVLLAEITPTEEFYL
ncbi:MAG: hypothetical protein M3Q44_00575 [bacterium]|nr:hypothetical protein [bacterium]